MVHHFCCHRGPLLLATYTNTHVEIYINNALLLPCHKERDEPCIFVLRKLKTLIKAREQKQTERRDERKQWAKRK
jgi:hypothetical protein